MNSDPAVNQTRKEDFDIRGILDKGLLTTDRLQNITAIIYNIILSADGRNAQEMDKKIKEVIPLFEYLELDIKRVEGALRGA